MFEAINGKQLPFLMNSFDQILIPKYKTGSGDNHLLCYCPQCEEKIQNFPLCNRNLILFVVASKRLRDSFCSNFSCLCLLNLKSTFSTTIPFSLKANFHKEKHHFITFTKVTCTKKTHSYDDPRATIL